jgi:hypothetical protein
VLAMNGRVYVEVPFMQTFHASPDDYNRWTAEGLKQLLKWFQIIELKVTAGPSTAFAWQFQETMATLFSFRSEFLYKIGLRLFGYFAILISRIDCLLEDHPHAKNAASGFSVTARKE